MKYSYSFNNEEYEGCFDTFDEAFDEAFAVYEDTFEPDERRDTDSVHIAEMREYSLTELIPNKVRFAEAFLDRLNEAAGDVVGDIAGDSIEDWLMDIPTGEALELSALLLDAFEMWAQKYNHAPHFYTIESIKTCFIAASSTGK